MSSSKKGNLRAWQICAHQSCRMWSTTDNTRQQGVPQLQHKASKRPWMKDRNLSCISNNLVNRQAASQALLRICWITNPSSITRRRQVDRAKTPCIQDMILPHLLFPFISSCWHRRIKPPRGMTRWESRFLTWWWCNNSKRPRSSTMSTAWSLPWTPGTEAFSYQPIIIAQLMPPMTSITTCIRLSRWGRHQA